jgi:hypothetical protein
MRPNDGTTYRFLVHEASHKFAATQDHRGGGYFSNVSLYETWIATRAVIPAAPPPWNPQVQPLTEAECRTHADSYGCFAANYRELRRSQHTAPWV